MQLRTSDIFWKAWWWSLVCGSIFGIFFYAATNIDGLFHWPYGGAAFFDLFMTVSIGGCYFGAGYVGWRIAVKHYHDDEKRFISLYIKYSAISFIVLVAVAYSPLSVLALLWSFVAPLAVVMALTKVRPPELARPKRKTTRGRRRPS